MTNHKQSVVIADDHDLIRLALRKVFEGFEAYEVTHEARDSYELIDILNRYPSEFLLLDLNMPGKSGSELLQEIRERFPRVKVIVLTVEDSITQVNKAMAMGATGYLLKENAIGEIQKALDDINRGKTFISHEMMVKMLSSKKQQEDNVLLKLSERELEVLYYISKGKTNKEIGDILYLSEKTVRNYSSSIFRKLEVTDRLTASILALKQGIEDLMGQLSR